MKKLTITCYADLQCPFCYTGETNLKNALDELGLTDQTDIIWKSVEIHDPADGNGEHEMIDIMMRKDGMSRQEAEDNIASINKMAKEEADLDINFGHVHESNDHKAHRLFKLAQTLGKGEEMRSALHQAYFHDCLVLDDPETLLLAAKKAGLPEEQVCRILEGDIYDQEVEQDEQDFINTKAECVPYFIIGDHPVEGHLTKDGYSKLIKNMI